MCVIVGYSGNRQAAPILVEMMKRIEYFDGGYATGIATIHEGKLYYAKAKGNVDMLLKMTDALNFPGTTGILHSRPGFDFFSTTHPYVDEAGKLALVTNGTSQGTSTPEFYEEMRTVMDELLDRGIRSRVGDDIKPEGFFARYKTRDGRGFWSPESLSFSVGYAVENAPAAEKRRTLADAERSIHERLPADQVSVSIHADVPDTLTVCTITRPMSVLEADGESYIASCGIAFPDDAEGKVTHLPQCSLTQITPDGILFTEEGMKGVRCEPVTEKIVDAYVKMFEEQTKEKALSVYELKKPNVWHEPMVDCDLYRVEGGRLKPQMSAFYQAAYRLYKEGRLSFYTGEIYARDVDWPNVDCYFTKFRVQ